MSLTSERPRSRAHRSDRVRVDDGKSTAPKQLRCTIYTRKSTENGLEQAFNSLDNQREAAEAYIKSQAHEGWRLVPGAYDDGGFSGGSLERPAIQHLLAEVRAGRVDVIVVYKVDRLTRSLSDFAKLVDLFDVHGVSFVSVTQAFNTTTSMGRLTLNVLLSFAQFEREVTGERIRDKIAASKKKGMRVGGPVPIGYRVRDKKLVPEPVEAEHVNLIFCRYLELGSLALLLQDLRERGIMTKANPRRDGSIRGGIAFDRGGLAALLKNRAYIGEVIHKGRHYPGEHDPIVPRDVFDAVQDAMAAKARNAGTTILNRDSLLKGLLYDQHGRRMMPSLSTKNGARYRYYASNPRQNDEAPDGIPAVRVQAPEIEAVVLGALQIEGGIQPMPSQISDGADAHGALRGRLYSSVDHIALKPGLIEITFRPRNRDGAKEREPMLVPWSPTPSRRRRAIIGIGTDDQPTTRPIRAETRARLISGIANARLWLNELATGRVADAKAIAERQGCSERSVRSTLNLAFLAPTIVHAAVDGTLPDGSGVVSMTEMPVEWPRPPVAGSTFIEPKLDGYIPRIPVGSIGNLR